MKKTLKLVSLLLIIAMTLSFFPSCGMTPEKRVTKAIVKMLSTEKFESHAKSSMSFVTTIRNIATNSSETITISQNSSATIEVITKGDASNQSNPLIAIYSKVNIESTDPVETNIYYANGYMYTAQGDEKTKEKMSFEEMIEDQSASSDFTVLFSYILENPEKITIIESEDGTLCVEIPLTNDANKEMLDTMIGKTVMEALKARSNITYKDTVVKITIDKNNNITNMEMSVSMSTRRVVSGHRAEVELSLDLSADYLSVGDDFNVGLPNDLDKYITEE